MRAGKLSERVQFRRAVLSDNGLEQIETFANHGSPVWAERRDVSDGERWRAGETAAHITTRFWVRESAFTKGLTPKDRLVCKGVEYDISGIKEAEATAMFEITAAARAD